MRKLTFQQQVFTSFCITLAVVFFVAIASYLSIKDQEDDSAWTEQTEQVLKVNYDIQQSLADAETNERGYVITHHNSFLNNYHVAVNKVNPYIAQLRTMVPEADYVKTIDSLSYYAALKIKETEHIIALAKGNTGFNDPVFKETVRRATFYMDRVRAQTVRIGDFEEKMLAERKEESRLNGMRTLWVVLGGTLAVLTLLMWVFRFIKGTFKHQKQIEERIRETNSRLRQVSEENETRNWLLAGIGSLDDAMRGEPEISELSEKIITVLAKYSEAQIGVFYTADENQWLKLSGSYAFYNTKGDLNEFRPGEGLAGQVALEKKAAIFTGLPGDYIKIASGVGSAVPNSILIQPVLFEGELRGVIELGFWGEVTNVKSEFIEKAAERAGVALNTAESRVRLRTLFEKTQQQAEELESQHEELRATNEELVFKTHQLESSEEELKVQQEELRQANAELEEKAEMLEERNRLIEQTKEAIGQKAKELEQTSKYKSEFLANMSHELRTPLNSILILAKILKENKPSNLTEEQLKYAGVIHNAGRDLLTLINDILDLSKIESGKIDLTIEKVYLQDLKTDVELLFAEVANDKKINFSCSIKQNVPEFIVSDKLRIEQILKNLLSNAFKFTGEKGSVTVTMEKVSEIPAGFSLNFSDVNNLISVSVSDTGIGIPEDKQMVIFEAFKQADGSTSRKFGGTGLGLSISRELAHLLGGEIVLKSEYNKGSVFTLFLPLTIGEVPEAEKAPETIPLPLLPEESPKEVFNHLESAEGHRLLIVEDDKNFASILSDYAEERGFTPIVANSGDTGLDIAGKQLPDAIVLDIMLPEMDGWTVLRKLKENPATCNIPVHLMSARNETNAKALHEGAIGFLRKPVEKADLDKVFDRFLSTAHNDRLKRILIIEDQKILSDNLKNELIRRETKVKQAFDGKEALEILNADNNFDCIILDLKLPDISGIELLEKIKKDSALSDIPVIINTAMELDKDSLEGVMKYTNAMVLKTDKSNERLLDEVTLFMNRVKNGIPGKVYAISGKSEKNNSTLEKVLKGKSVLLVDDDMRNIFALSSALENFDLKIEIAGNGREAIEKLEANQAINIVLMDLMMPEMDGYEAIRAIRSQSRFNRLPVIALTAKAMKNDREKCIEAGANDYIAKPLDLDKLLSMMRVWLS